MKPGKHSGFDVPVEDPAGDLLDMDGEARGLVRYVAEKSKKLPFTLGILGKWGEGKTTLVRLLRYHLSHPEGPGSGRRLDFVEFSAWPYNTSEKLWRALIVKIARTLYGQEEDAEEVARPGEGAGPGLFGSVADFLSAEVVLRKQETDYEKFLRRLDRADYGSLDKRTPEVQLDEGATTGALVSGAVAALGTASPIFTALFGLFGIEPRIDAQKLIRHANEVKRENIEALDHFRAVFKQMIAERPEEKRRAGPVYVFVDDLDRAQPDVALDIIESISIALYDVDCVFILAVDERLIAEGLRLRYPKLFADKGAEYLEKIIHFRTRVPPRRGEQVQRLIAGEYPEWAAVGDLVMAVAGTNPRRVKQYCERLNFQSLTGKGLFAPAARPPEEEEMPQQPDGETPPPTDVEQGVDAGPPPPDTTAPKVIRPATLGRALRKLSRDEVSEIALNLGHPLGSLTGENLEEKIDSLVSIFSDNLDRLVEEIRSTHPELLN
jgi:hypothetical protein